MTAVMVRTRGSQLRSHRDTATIEKGAELQKAAPTLSEHQVRVPYDA